MKNSLNDLLVPNLKKMFPIMILLASFLIVSCGGGGQDRVRHQQLEELREETLTDLNSIIFDIEERVKYVDEQLPETSGEVTSELEDAREELIQQKELVEAEVIKVENATLNNWNDVIEGTSEVAVHARTRTNEISRDVRESLEN
jgi:hypothetical protein